MPNIHASLNILTMTRPNLLSGTVRCFVSTVQNPSSGGAGVGDSILWGRLPVGARVLPGSRLFWSTGNANSSVGVGDSGNNTRYMAATSVAIAGSAPVENSFANGALFEITNPDHTLIRSQVTGAALADGQVLTLVLLYAVNS